MLLTRSPAAGASAEPMARPVTALHEQCACSRGLSGHAMAVWPGDVARQRRSRDRQPSLLLEAPTTVTTPLSATKEVGWRPASASCARCP